MAKPAFVVVDGGNSRIKAKSASREVAFIHSLIQLSETEWGQFTTRLGRAHPDLVKVNGVPFIIDETAIRHGFEGRKFGSDRYNELYYGTLVAAGLARLYDQSMNNLLLYASHAPKDIDYRPDIIAAARHKWVVETEGRTLTFCIDDVRCFDEPVGGIANVMLSDDGQRYRHPELRTGRVLVIDIGGLTVDTVIVREGQPDYTTAESTMPGIIDVEERFVKLFRSQHSRALQSSNWLDPEQVRDALITGEMDAGGLGLIPCEDQVREATAQIISRIEQLFTRAGGVANFHYIVLTGGGGGLLLHRIRAALRFPEERILLADDMADIHFANTRGGFKLLRMFEYAGMIS